VHYLHHCLVFKDQIAPSEDSLTSLTVFLYCVKQVFLATAQSVFWIDGAQVILYAEKIGLSTPIAKKFLGTRKDLQKRRP